MAVAATSALQGHVLVLNRYYAAIRVVSVRRALSMLYRRMAEVVHVEDNTFEGFDFESWRELSAYRARYQRTGHEWIRCVRFELAVPHVIRLLLYERLPRQVVKLNRRNIYARDHSRCQYCGRKFPTSELSLDHVIPRVQGGTTSWENVVCCCVKCNVRKGGRSPEQAHMKLIAAPVKPKRPPAITLRLTPDRYASWRQFLNEAYWSVEFKD
ncbi:MAG: HNH endonuclease [Planctomycetes bacterium]|nr:HNH endonuclease [Planctomycetota bacterium]